MRTSKDIETVDGDSKPMPNRGTSTGLNGSTYGADLSGDATNSMGNISGSTQSQAALDNCIPDPMTGDC